MSLTPAQLGFVRAIGYTLLTALLAFLANQANLTGIVGDSAALIIAGLAASLEHYIESQTGNALFGAVRSV